MVSKAQKFRLGIFITVVSLLLLGFIFVVAGSKMVQKRDIYYIRYHDTTVNGLQIGSAVKYHGITIGRVDDISIDTDNVRDIIVTISVKKGTPLKEDVMAVLTPVGITGLMQVELRGGTNKKQFLKPYAFIKAGPSMFQNITGKAEIITDKLEIMLNNLNTITSKENQQRIKNILKNIDDSIESNKKEVGNIVAHSDSLIITANNLLTELSKTTEQINKIMYSKELEDIISNTQKISEGMAQVDYKQFSKDLKKTIKLTNKTLSHLDGLINANRQDIRIIIDNLRETVDYLNDFSRQLSENPSVILKSKKQ